MTANQTKALAPIDPVDVEVSCRAYSLAADLRKIAVSSNQAHFYFILILQHVELQFFSLSFLCITMVYRLRISLILVMIDNSMM